MGWAGVEEVGTQVDAGGVEQVVVITDVVV